MTPSDLYDRIRQDADRPPFDGEAVATDADAEAAASGTLADAELLPLVWSAADAVAAVVDARHVPARVQTRLSNGALREGDLRLLRTRVAGTGGQPLGSETLALYPATAEAWRRRGPLPGAYAEDGGQLYGAQTYAAVTSPANRGGGDDLGLPDHLAHAVVLHVLAAVWASRGDGRAVPAQNGYRRAVAPYRVTPEAGE